MLSNVPARKKSSVVRKTAAPEPPQSSRYSVPVVRSTFRILQELARAEMAGLQEITRNTGISKSTVFRILVTLHDLGYVLRDENRNYRVSPALGRLVGEDSVHELLRHLALPSMLDLRDRFGETVNLGVRHFDQVTYLEVVPSEFALRLEESRGASAPAHASALGKAILAFSPQPLVQDLIRGRPLAKITPNTISSPDAFLAELRHVAAAGIAFDRGEGSLLAVCVSAPILGPEGHAVAALSLSGPASRFNPGKESPVVAALLKATASISRNLARSLPA